jgi:hypothetical protein
VASLGARHPRRHAASQRALPPRRCAASIGGATSTAVRGQPRGALPPWQRVASHGGTASQAARGLPRGPDSPKRPYQRWRGRARSPTEVRAWRGKAHRTGGDVVIVTRGRERPTGVRAMEEEEKIEDNERQEGDESVPHISRD